MFQSYHSSIQTCEVSALIGVIQTFQSYHSSIQTSCDVDGLTRVDCRFNPIIVRFKQKYRALYGLLATRFQSYHSSIQTGMDSFRYLHAISFNPIIVRFKLWRLILLLIQVARFNPIIVRFKLMYSDLFDVSYPRFNPIIVRFKHPVNPLYIEPAT